MRHTLIERCHLLALSFLHNVKQRIVSRVCWLNGWLLVTQSHPEIDWHSGYHCCGQDQGQRYHGQVLYMLLYKYTCVCPSDFLKSAFHIHAPPSASTIQSSCSSIEGSKVRDLVDIFEKSITAAHGYEYKPSPLSILPCPQPTTLTISPENSLTRWV